MPGAACRVGGLPALARPLLSPLAGPWGPAAGAWGPAWQELIGMDGGFPIGLAPAPMPGPVPGLGLGAGLAPAPEPGAEAGFLEALQRSLAPVVPGGPVLGGPVL
ncbi:MAG: hypothetical protein K5Q68_24660, partial [Roseococcus sp.]|nr:hypothetical protein [Roseococcus sp.]